MYRWQGAETCRLLFRQSACARSYILAYTIIEQNVQQYCAFSFGLILIYTYISSPAQQKNKTKNKMKLIQLCVLLDINVNTKYILKFLKRNFFRGQQQKTHSLYRREGGAAAAAPIILHAVMCAVQGRVQGGAPPRFTPDERAHHITYIIHSASARRRVG